MSTAPTQLTRHDLETQLIAKAWKDPEFKKRVVTDPKVTFETHFGTKLTEWL